MTVGWQRAAAAVLVAAAAAAAWAVPAAAQAPAERLRAFDRITERTVFPVRRLADGVYLVPGDSGRGAEGRPNAGFVDTPEGVLVVGGLASPAQARAVLRSIRTVTRRPVRWLVLHAHHPDMQFGAVELRRAGAQVIAHPDTRVLAGEQGDDAMVAGWVPVVGVEEMLGFEFANRPDRAVSGTDTLVLGGRRVVLWHPGPAHSAGDLMLWVPDAGVLFAGDVLVEDGVTMVVDGDSRVLLTTLDSIAARRPRVVVPGHGRVPGDPDALLARTRAYVTALRSELREMVASGQPMTRALRAYPAADPDRPVSEASRRRRNAARVWVELEREVLGLDGSAPPRAAPTTDDAPAGRPGLIGPDTLAAWIARGRPHRLLDVRGDVVTYLEGHLPGAAYLNVETLRAVDGGMPVELLDADAYRALFSRLGIRLDEPVVVYSAGETKNIDATFVAWLLEAFGHPAVHVLDGGWARWHFEQRPETQAYPRFARAPGWAGRPFRPRLARLADVQRALADPRAVVVDARPPEQFRGEAGAQVRRGHIPGAVPHYWQDDLHTVGFGRVFRPRDALRAAYAAQGITPDRRVVLYCNSATEASHNLFVLAYLLGYPDVTVYVPSWTEWAERLDLPVATGP